MVTFISLLLWIGVALLVWMATLLIGAAVRQRPRKAAAIPAVLAFTALAMAALIGFVALVVNQEGLS